MSARKKMRQGDYLTINDRRIDFSFYPVYKPKKRATMHTVMYTSNPWEVFRMKARETFSLESSDFILVNSFINQAEDYYRAAKNSSNSQTTPLLFYYSFLNLGKALVKIRKNKELDGNVSHGMHSDNAHPKTIEKAKLINDNPSNKKSAIKEISSVFPESKRNDIFSPSENLVKNLFEQSVIGQRLFVEASGGNRRQEKFIHIDRIDFMQDKSNSEIWTRILIAKDKFTGEARGQNEVLKNSGLSDCFSIVSDSCLSKDYVIFESKNPIKVNNHYVRDKIPELVQALRPYLWEVIMTGESLRKYYLYLADKEEKVFPQWFSLYAGFFWLGYLSRYFPSELVDLQNGKFGPFLAEFIESQPQQLLYLFASEVKQQVVTKSNII